MDQPSIAMPPTLVDISEEQTATLSLANGSPVNYSIPEKTLIGVAEKIDSETASNIETLESLESKVPDRIKVANRLQAKFEENDLKRSPVASDEEWKAVNKLVKKYAHVFAASDDELGSVEGTSAHINTEGVRV